MKKKEIEKSQKRNPAIEEVKRSKKASGIYAEGVTILSK